MKKALKYFSFFVIFLIVLAASGLAYFHSKYPIDILVSDIKVEATPQRIERGEYLVKHVVLCIDCHSERNWSNYAAPIVEGTYGKGGEVFSHENVGLPGIIYAKNITPFKLKNYSDGELYRVITTGITNEGKALFPLMPYLRYRELAREDVYSIIAYIRTLKPIEYTANERKLDFPMNLIVNTIPMKDSVIAEIPDKRDTLAYGKYMLNAAACVECHTRLDDKGQYIEGMMYAGGFRFMLPNGDEVYSANITPDMETGIGTLSKESFIAKFKAFEGEEAKHIKVENHNKNTIMPWTQFAGMKDEDLAAIYAYLRTVKPVKNKIETFRPAKINL